MENLRAWTEPGHGTGLPAGDRSARCASARSRRGQGHRRLLINVREYGVLKPKRHFDSVYYQDATPVRDQTTVVGHAVRALYLLAGVVDLYLETGEEHF